MRLNNFQRQAIKEAFHEVFQEGDIYLFGSRVDDDKRGGDIDLYLVCEKAQNLLEKKIDFLVSLKSKIGEQKVDVVFDIGKNRAIDQNAKSRGIRL